MREPEDTEKTFRLTSVLHEPSERHGTHRHQLAETGAAHESS